MAASKEQHLQNLLRGKKLDDRLRMFAEFRCFVGRTGWDFVPLAPQNFSEKFLDREGFHVPAEEVESMLAAAGIAVAAGVEPIRGPSGEAVDRRLLLPESNPTGGEEVGAIAVLDEVTGAWIGRRVSMDDAEQIASSRELQARRAGAAPAVLSAGKGRTPMGGGAEGYKGEGFGHDKRYIALDLSIAERRVHESDEAHRVVAKALGVDVVEDRVAKALGVDEDLGEDEDAENVRAEGLPKSGGGVDGDHEGESGLGGGADAVQGRLKSTGQRLAAHISECRKHKVQFPFLHDAFFCPFSARSAGACRKSAGADPPRRIRPCGCSRPARLLTLGIQSQESRVMNSTDMVHHRRNVCV